MSRSEWNELAAAALRRGQSLKDASRAYRAANAHVHPDPGDGTSPEMHRRHKRKSTLGSLLSRGVPFHEAARKVDEGFDAYQSVTRGVERSITHPTRHNPDVRKLLTIAAIGVGAFWLWRQNNTMTVLAGPTQGQTPASAPNAAQTGGGSYQTLTLVPNATAYQGYAVYGAQ